MSIKKTALYDRHVACGGRMVEFAGYMLPVQYTGINQEHNAVRESCGLFDVSHMGEVVVKGSNALDFVQNLLTNDFSEMVDGQVKYSPMCNHEGGVIDDLLVYRDGAEHFTLVVNAANREKDFNWMKANNPMGAELSDLSDSYSQLAIQGPKAEAIIKSIADELPVEYYSFVKTKVAGETCILSRTGYTGEDGFEIYCKNEVATKLWDAVMESGGEEIIPCGLGARDTLRLEAAMPLYGHEMDEMVTPLEAGLKYFVKTDKACDFIGKAALQKQLDEKLKRRRCGLEIVDKGIARDGAEISVDGKVIGKVTSGTRAPNLKKAVALALVDVPYHKRDTELSVNVRGRELKAVVIRLPFYKRSK